MAFVTSTEWNMVGGVGLQLLLIRSTKRFIAGCGLKKFFPFLRYCETTLLLVLVYVLVNRCQLVDIGLISLSTVGIVWC